MASLFSKLDRDIELEWLADREGVQRVLASVLSCPVARVQASLEGALGAQEEARGAYRFSDAPQARPLELAREPPPPGFPELLWAPRRWQRHFWPISEGSGTDLVAAWLAARSLAHCIRAPDAGTALGRLDPAGPNFIRLEHAPPPDLAWPELPLVVAAPGPALAGFATIAEPPVAAYLSELVSWFSDRMPADGRLDPGAAVAWFEANSDLTGDFDTIVGCLALLDEFGAKRVTGKSRTQLAKLFLARRITDGTSPGDDASWVEENALSIVSAIVRSSLTDSARDPAAPRPRQEWVDSVPEEFRRGVDVEWVKASLLSAGTALSVQELERALTRAPPGAHRVVTALERAGLLSPRDEGLVLGPRWLLRTAERLAIDELLASSGLEWGEALLGGARSAEILAALAARMRLGDFRFVDRLVDHGDAASPAFAAAVSALTATLGAVLLAGVEAELDTVSALLELATEQVVRFDDGTLVPRVAIAGVPDGAFLVGAWALSEALLNEGRQLRGPLEPARATVSNLDQAHAFLEEQSPNEWALAAKVLIAKVAHETHSEHAACLPLAVDATWPWARLSTLSRTRHGLAALRHHVASEGAPERPWPRVAEWIWQAWFRAGFPATTLFDRATDSGRELWSHLPVAVLGALLEVAHPVLRDVPLDAFGEATLRLLLERSDRLPAFDRRGVPAALVGQAVDAALRTSNQRALGSLWQAHEGPLLERTSRAQHSGDEHELGLLLGAAPARAESLLLALFSTRLREEGVGQPGVDPIRRWLIARCRFRGENFREAYALLHDVEERLARVARARGPGVVPAR